MMVANGRLSNPLKQSSTQTILAEYPLDLLLA
jgi:hypothetical protein